MRILNTFLTVLFTLLTGIAISQQIHHEIEASLDIPKNAISVKDRVTLPKAMLKPGKAISFSLNKNLILIRKDYSGIQITGPNAAGEEAIYSTYKIELSSEPSGDLTIPFEYSGVINDQIKEGAAEYARGFSETSGIICEDGVYLGGSTYWLPSFDEPLFTFNLEVTLKKDWNVVSQGTGTKNTIENENRLVRYESPNPDEEAYLIAGPLTEYEQDAGHIKVQAFLRTPDEELAQRYMGVTSQYLAMYENLIGPYPYTKFALVENFWETGYGMPSFTLLGQKVIRLPFILYTSYPHELLHNWWGNSVYVEMESGNWCEGITAYMADHLLKEQQGQGAAYRQTTLQKFTDYVNESNDFPLVDFRSRNNSAEEAIGYGKCLMMNHMLRKEVGDEQFREAYQDFYLRNKFRIASFDDIRNSFEKITGLDLKPFFDQWLLRKGAPNLKLLDVNSEKQGDFYQLTFSLEQTQQADPFFINIPVAVFFENKVEKKVLTMDLQKQKFAMSFSDRPVRLEIDPQFDVFRRLDKAEVPPALSQVFGSPDALIILPSKSDLLDDYKQLAETWQKSQEAQGKKLEVVDDSELDHLPTDKSAWVIGFENKFAGVFNVTEDYKTALGDENTLTINRLSLEGSLVYAIPNPEDQTYALGFVGTNVKAAVPGLTRLLPHYGKYSYLGFEGDRPNNVLKGTFPALHSPLQENIPYQGKTIASQAMLPPEPPLTE